MYENSSNGKVYIGQTVHPEKRKKRHEKAQNKNKFHSAIKSYGFDHFQYIVLYENVPENQLDALEKYCIWIFDSMNSGYNMTAGGDSNPSHNPEVVEKRNKTIREPEYRESASKRATEMNRKRIEEGTHHFITDNPNIKRIEDGTHNFITDHPMKKTENRDAQSKRLRENNPNIKRIKDGTHHFITDNPNDDPILLNKAQRGRAKTRRKKKEELGQTYLFSDILEQEENNANNYKTRQDQASAEN